MSVASVVTSPASAPRGGASAASTVGGATEFAQTMVLAGEGIAENAAASTSAGTGSERDGQDDSSGETPEHAAAGMPESPRAQTPAGLLCGGMPFGLAEALAALSPAPAPPDTAGPASSTPAVQALSAELSPSTGALPSAALPSTALPPAGVIAPGLPPFAPSTAPGSGVTSVGGSALGAPSVAPPVPPVPVPLVGPFSSALSSALPSPLSSAVPSAPVPGVAGTAPAGGPDAQAPGGQPPAPVAAGPATAATPATPAIAQEVPGAPGSLTLAATPGPTPVPPTAAQAAQAAQAAAQVATPRVIAGQPVVQATGQNPVESAANAAVGDEAGAANQALGTDALARAASGPAQVVTADRARIRPPSNTVENATPTAPAGTVDGADTPIPGGTGTAPTVAEVRATALAALDPAARQHPHPVPMREQVAKPLLALAAAGNGDHMVTISVTPDALGPVTVRAHISDGQVRLELFAPTDPGRDSLRQLLPDLRRDLASADLGATLDLSSDNGPSSGDSRRDDAPVLARHANQMTTSRRQSEAGDGVGARTADPQLALDVLT